MSICFGKNVLLTGSTGFLGSWVLRRILESPLRDVNKIYVTLRANSSNGASTVEQLFASNADILADIVDKDTFMKKVEAIDLNNDTLKMAKVSATLNVAGNTDWRAPLHQVLDDNLSILKSIVRNVPKGTPITQVSTSLVQPMHMKSLPNAYVSYKPSNEYCNNYARSKAVLEHYIMTDEECKDFPVNVVRPMGITGVFRSKKHRGWSKSTRSYNGFFYLLSRHNPLSKGLPVPCIQHNRTLLCPVDVVADVVLSSCVTQLLLESSSAGQRVFMNAVPNRTRDIEFEDFFRSQKERIEQDKVLPMTIQEYKENMKRFITASNNNPKAQKLMNNIDIFADAGVIHDFDPDSSDEKFTEDQLTFLRNKCGLNPLFDFDMKEHAKHYVADCHDFTWTQIILPKRSSKCP